MKYILLLSSIIFTNCGGAPHKAIDPAFQPYYDSFIFNGIREGRDLSQNDITIEFQNTEDIPSKAGGMVVGICEMGENIVLIDKSSWKRFSNYDRELLIYHELGHCLLNRLHVVGTHNDIISIMNPFLFVRYADKRDYYIHELFHPSTQTVLSSLTNVF